MTNALRPSELFGLKWKCFDAKASAISIQETTHRGKIRTYEPGRHVNLIHLHERLQGGWKPTSPIRVYMPKASGLLKPLTLLALDDQIVLQAIAR
jgi:integrase